MFCVKLARIDRHLDETVALRIYFDFWGLLYDLSTVDKKVGTSW